MSLKLAYSEAPNMAPSQDLRRYIEQQAQDRSVQVDTDWFKTTKKELEQEDKSTWDNEALKWALVLNFIEGRHLLKRAKYGFGWRAVPFPNQTDIPVYGFNLTGFYSENIKSKWSNSNTKIRWRPARETDDAIGASKGGQVAHDHYGRKLYTTTFRQMESTLAQIGKYARYYYYSDEGKSYARRPVVEPVQMQFGEGSWFCPDCGAGGDLGGLGASDQGAMRGTAGAVLSGDGGSAGDTVRTPDAGGLGAYGAEPDQTILPNPSPSGLDMASGASATLGGINVGAIPAQGGLNAPMGAAHLGRMGQGYNNGQQYVGSPGDFGAYDSGAAGGVAGIGADPYQEQAGASQGMACPSCGSPNLEIQSVPPLETEAVTGYEHYEHGDIICETVPAFELKHDLACLPQDSPYLVRRRRVRLPVLQSKFPFLHIAQSKGNDRGLAIEDSLKRSSAASNTYFSKDSNDEPATDFIQVWLDPCMYSRLVLKDAVQTLSGETIPAQTPLTQLFPDGIYMCFVEGIDGVVELRNEHHKDYWVGQEYRQRAISKLGCGIEDIVEGNRQYNLVMSIIYTQLRTSAMPATLYDERLLPNGVSAYLGSLSNLPVNLSALEDQRRLQDAVYQLQPQPPTAQHFGYKDALNQYMQLASRVTDFSGGLPGVNNKTATGAEITNANSQSLFGPQLALKAEVDRRGAEIVLELFKKYCIDEVWVTLAGKRGELDGMWLSAASIGVDLFAEVVPDSYLPQTNLERRERWDGFLERVGGLPGLKLALQEFPEQVEQLAEIFDVDLASADYTAAAEMCRLRIDQMSAALPMVGIWMQGMPPTQMTADPMTGAMVEVPIDPMAEAGQFLLSILQPPIELEETGHMAAIAYLRSWLTEDEGRKAPTELRAGVKAMIRAHLDGLMAEAELTGMVQMAGQPMPVMPEQNADGNDRKNKTPDANQMKPSQQAKQQRKEQQKLQQPAEMAA